MKSLRDAEASKEDVTRCPWACCLSLGLRILLHAGEQDENRDKIKTTQEVINYAAEAVAFEAG